MRLRDRLDHLERTMQAQDAYRLLVTADDADAETARAEYLTRTGYRGVLIVITETDARL